MDIQGHLWYTLAKARFAKGVSFLYSDLDKPVNFISLFKFNQTPLLPMDEKVQVLEKLLVLKYPFRISPSRTSFFFTSQ